MSDGALKIARVVSMFLTSPAASFARGGHGGGGFAHGFARPAGSAGTGNVPISGIPRGPANVGGINNVTVDSSGVVNAFRAAGLPQPHIAAPTQPGGSRNPVVPPSTNLEAQSLLEQSGGHPQPRPNQVPSEDNLMNPNDPVNRENAALDRTLNICRGC